MTVSPAPEYALLLDAVAPLGRARVDHRAWDGPCWGRAVRAADWHRLSPLLFCHLRADEHVPGAVLSALERAYLAAAARSLFLAEALREALAALAAAEVRAMPLKGAALAGTAYPNPAQREMLDLDVLVPAERLGAANAALAALGYGTLPGDEPAPGGHRAVHHDPALVRDERLVAIELHHHVAIAGEGRAIDVGELWRRARPVPGATHVLPAPEHLLLHVCLHFTRNRLGGSYRRRHTGGALAQVCDVARIVARAPLDWDALARDARGWGVDARVFLALFVARELGVPVPDAALAALRPAGFDARLGRRLVALRVLGMDEHLPVRSLRWMVAPGREALARGWSADPGATRSLARAYLRRARAQGPLARSALRRPWSVVQDRRLNRRLLAIEERA